MKKNITWIGILAVISVSLYLVLKGDKDGTMDPLEEEQQIVIVPDDYIYGYHRDSFLIDFGIIQPNEFLSNILTDFEVPYKQIDQLANCAESTFSVRKLRSGKRYAILRKDSLGPASKFIYEASLYRYICFDIDSCVVEVVNKPIDTSVTVFAGRIDQTLWMTMYKAGLPDNLIDKMEDALAWSVDFYHIQDGDAFSLIYEDLCIDNESAGIGRLLGAYFYSGGKEYYSIWYNSGKYEGYFDENGLPMKKAFLRAPVRYSRISSRYSMRRFHPTLKRYRSHLGTDYAAPYGTEIMAVADGQVTKSSYTKGNGNYVKIRHDDSYETQYLHMSRFASGIRPGKRVKQGDVIGYVGQTGYASGPHVCFRFWKNGRQVNHLRENLPPPDPMDEADLPAYLEFGQEMKARLDEIPIPRREETLVTEKGEASSSSTEAGSI